MTRAASPSPAGSSRGPVILTVPSRHGDAEVMFEPASALDSRASPAFIGALTHGAGGSGVDTPDLLAVQAAALTLGGAVARITQPYRVRGARAPGSVARQDDAWADVISALRASTGGTAVPLIQGGRSNGARLACRTARRVGAAAVIALAFPLHSPGHPERSRRSELLAAGVPVLAVSGGRDPFGIPGQADADRVVVLQAEGHTLAKDPAAIGEAVLSWLPRHLGGCGASGSLRG